MDLPMKSHASEIPQDGPPYHVGMPLDLFLKLFINRVCASG